MNKDAYGSIILKMGSTLSAKQKKMAVISSINQVTKPIDQGNIMAIAIIFLQQVETFS